MEFSLIKFHGIKGHPRSQMGICHNGSLQFFKWELSVIGSSALTVDLDVGYDSPSPLTYLWRFFKLLLCYFEDIF